MKSPQKSKTMIPLRSESVPKESPSKNVFLKKESPIREELTIDLDDTVEKGDNEWERMKLESRQKAAELVREKTR